MPYKYKLQIFIIPLIIIPIVIVSLIFINNTGQSIEKSQIDAMEFKIETLKRNCQRYDDILKRSNIDEIDYYIRKAKDKIKALAAGIEISGGNIFIADTLTAQIVHHPELSQEEMKETSGAEYINELIAYKQREDVGEYVEGYWIYEGIGRMNYQKDNKDYTAILAYFNKWNWVLVASVNTETLYTAIDNARNFAIFVMITAIVVATLILFFITRGITKPIEILKDSAIELGKGNLDSHINIKSKDEFGTLGNVFNEMTEKLEESFEKIEKQNEQIQKYNESLEQMVAKRTEELNEANKVLSQRNEQMKRELEMAERVQRSIIPDEMDFPKRKELTFGSNYSSMESIGGDLYDVIRVGRNAYGMLMVDVSGHGVPAALITTMAKVSFNSHTSWNIPTGKTCKSVNEEIYRFIGDLEHYLTAYYGILNLEDGYFSFTNAGHHPAILYRTDTGKIESLDTIGFFIGAFEDVEYGTGRVEINPGDRLLLFTDGIIEARNENNEFYSYERLYDFIIHNSDLPTKEFVDKLINNVKEYCGNQPQDDDRAILCIEMVSKISPEKTPEEMLNIEARKIEAEAEKDKKEYEEAEFLKNNYGKAIELIKLKKYDEALVILEELLDKHPDNPKILHSLGVAYFKSGNLEKAKQVLEDALQKDRSNEVLRKNLTIVMRKLDELNDNDNSNNNNNNNNN